MTTTKKPSSPSKSMSPPPVPLQIDETTITTKPEQAEQQRQSEDHVLLAPIFVPSEERLAVTLRTDVGFEYHMTLPRPVVEDLINPETPDTRIEVPCPLRGMQRFLHTLYIKELDVRGL